MKREEIITIILIILIIIFEIVSQNFTTHTMEELSSKLSELKNQSLNKEYTNKEFVEKTNTIYDDWYDKNKILSYYIEHDELEKINTQLKTIKADYESDLEEEVIPEIERGIYLLEHVKEKQQLSLQNIF